MELLVAPQCGQRIGVVAENVAARLRRGGKIEQGAVSVERAQLDPGERGLGHGLGV
jgi:hypothetical protein